MAVPLDQTHRKTEPPGKLAGRSGHRKFHFTTEMLLLAINVVIFIVMALLTDTFLTAYNVGNIFRQSAVIGIIAISSTVVIISGGIDLSVGSLAGLSAMITAVLMSETHGHMAILPAILIAVAAGTAVGLYHGFIIYDVRLPPFIATLGSMIVLRGIIKLISGAQTISNLPVTFTDFARLDVLGIPALVLVWLVVVAAITFVLRQTRFGRNIFVIGSSQEVARLSGIEMRLNVYGIYVLAAFLCSIAGVLLSSRLSSAVPTIGQGYEMTAIAAAAIGGASLSGARGSVLGTVLGTLLMALISNAGIHLEIDPFLMQSITGALLTIAVVIDMLRQRRG
jgi:ribose/xylose/arabinose/galactoside ABC-type transport system permease subunit